MQNKLKNIQVRAFTANSIYELGEKITQHIENWNNCYCSEEAYKPSYIKPLMVSHTVTVTKSPLANLSQYTEKDPLARKKNVLVRTPFTTKVEYSAIGVFEVVGITKEIAKAYQLQNA